MLNHLAVILWNYHDEDVKGDTSCVLLNLKNIPSTKVFYTEYRIDDAHSNTYEVWKKMGSPQNPSPMQVSQLEEAGLLQMNGMSNSIKVQSGIVNLKMAIPRQAVSLIMLEWE